MCCYSLIVNLPREVSLICMQAYLTSYTECYSWKTYIDDGYIVKPITNLADYIIANPSEFNLSLICKITNVDKHIDTSITKGDYENIGYFNKELDFCVYFEAVAYNCFEEIVVNGRHCFGNNRMAHKESLEFYTGLKNRSEAVQLVCNIYALVENEIAIYDPTIKRLGFKFES